ncbi:MAG: glycosyltransferase [Bacteroidia bacterium]
MKLIILGENGSVHVQKWIIAIASVPGIELHVITFKRGPEQPQVHYHYLKKFAGNKLDFLLNLFHFKRIVSEIKPDLIQAHYATSYGFLAAFSGFHPFIITGWGADIFDSPANPIMKSMLQYSFRKADAISVLSEVTRKEIKKLTNKHVNLIPFGVDTNKFNPRKRDDDKKIVRIGTIRTLSEKYGLEFLIKAFANAYAQHPEIRLEIVGDGPQKQMLNELCENLNISDVVTFHGYVNQNTDFEKYIALLQSFDIFAILSILDSETFGVAAVEASACGIPVVATNVGGLPEVIDDEKTGLIVPPKNAEATSEAFIRLIKDKSLREKLGAGGLAKASSMYNWKFNIQQMVDLYKKTMKKEVL